jgi:hypothetical protein
MFLEGSDDIVFLLQLQINLCDLFEKHIVLLLQPSYLLSLRFNYVFQTLCVGFIHVVEAFVIMFQIFGDSSFTYFR